MGQHKSSGAVFALIAALALVAIAAVAMGGAPRRSGFASPAATALATTKPLFDANGTQTTFSQFKASVPAAAPKDAAIYADMSALHRDRPDEFTADGIDKFVLG